MKKAEDTNKHIYDTIKFIRNGKQKHSIPKFSKQTTDKLS